jgi:hypothetical protein
MNKMPRCDGIEAMSAVILCATKNLLDHQQHSAIDACGEVLVAFIYYDSVAPGSLVEWGIGTNHIGSNITTMILALLGTYIPEDNDAFMISIRVAPAVVLVQGIKWGSMVRSPIHRSTRAKALLRLEYSLGRSTVGGGRMHACMHACW